MYHLPKNLLFVSSITCKMVKNLRKDDKAVCKFLKEEVTAYLNCAYMVEKLPLNNDFLKTLTTIDHMVILTNSFLHLLEIFINRPKLKL